MASRYPLLLEIPILRGNNMAATNLSLLIFIFIASNLRICNFILFYIFFLCKDIYYVKILPKGKSM